MDLYVVRHCHAEGQRPEAPLTVEGLAQAALLGQYLTRLRIDRIVCSPFVRARQSIEPLARWSGLSVEIDARLAERVLCGTPRADWRDRLRESFDDPELCLAGGEAGRDATARGVAAVEDARARGGRPVLVSHGNLMALILRHFDARFGFDEWQGLGTPDVFRVATVDGIARVERVWNDG